MPNKKKDRFMSMYRPVHPAFERFCRARAYGEMAPEDLINEVLLKAFEKMGELREEKAFFGYLCGIAIRVLASSNRKKRPESMDLHSPILTHPSVEPEIEKKLEVDRLYEAMAKLPVDQRESLILYEINGLSVKEVAALHGVGESAVKQRLRRGRMALADLLQDPESAGTTERSIEK